MACCTTSPMLKVTVEKPVYAQDSVNEQIATWSTYWTFYGTVRPMTSREVVQAEQVQGSSNWMVELPYGTKAMGVTGEMRCKFTYGRAVTAYCDGSAMPVGTKMARVRAVEQTA